jgi:hypothetical protein
VGGRGFDRLIARDNIGGNDTLNGGADGDVCVADVGDTTTNC